MANERIAVKAFILKDKKLLIVKRVAGDIQSPSVWEFPGGRLDAGENPFEGLKREVKEEAGINIEIKKPLNIQHFTREDGETITMIIFECTTNNDEVILDESEHSDFEWVDLEDAKNKLASFFHGEVDIYNNSK